MSFKEAPKKIREAQENNAIELDLSGLELTEIPSELSTLTQLTKLDLFGNNLKEIKGLERLGNLLYLNLAHNKIAEIKGLESLTQLTHLYLHKNKLVKIKGLEKLKKLLDITLGDNPINEINGLDTLTSLRRLELGGNQLSKIKILDDLSNLKKLELGDNRLTEITGLEKFTQLTYLDLRNNQLRELPKVLLELGQPIRWNLNKENGIFVGDNPFTNPPPEIIKQGNEAIREYFEQRRKTGEELLNEAKLILLGDGRSGKTSLANRLLLKDLPTEADRTQGVDIVIGEYGFPMANGKNFKVNIWDFAGQDKYKTLHQLFYTESSVYVMVAESGNTTTDFDDWFQTAQLFGEGSPLVLVLNEFKEGIGRGSFDSNHWKKQFPELLKEVFTVNLGTKQNLAAAEEYIRLIAQTLPHTKYAFPSNWAAIRRVLTERRNEQYITLQEYYKICRDNNLPEKESALILSSVLHKVGVCLHYQKNALLKQFIILKNEWATEAVYKILDDKIVAEDKSGFFDPSDMERVWNSPEYEDMRPQLLELMKQFKLAYQLPGREEYVTPPLLKPARPKSFTWQELDSLELYIDYEFLPKALLTQFIVTRHADIAEGRTLVWRHGVVLKWEGEAVAEVSRTKLQGRDAFYIRTQGNSRKEMLTVILKTFRALHDEYKGIKSWERVPCRCEGCRNKKNEQHYFDFANLKLRLEKGRYEVDCEKSLEPVNVMQLLENSFVFEQFKEGSSLQLKEDVVTESRPQTRVLNLFLASSKELEAERQKIEVAISRKNDALRKQNFYVDLRMWEDGKYIGKSLRSQDDYNHEIKECNFFAMLFYSKVGKYALEEFELANSLFENEAMPRIRIFQKDADLPRNQSETDSVSRFSFLKLLQEKEHFPVLFQNTDKLVNELEDAIYKLLQDEAFVKQLKAE